MTAGDARGEAATPVRARICLLVETGNENASARSPETWSAVTTTLGTMVSRATFRHPSELAIGASSKYALPARLWCSRAERALSGMPAIEVEVVIGAKQGRDAMRFTSSRQREPLRPAHALLPFDHQTQIHQVSAPLLLRPSANASAPLPTAT